MKNILLFMCCLLPFICFADGDAFVYKGTVDNRSITMYLTTSNGCGPDNYRGMYLYDGVSKWLLLNIDHNDKGAFSMVEENFTGLMILTKKGDQFEGLWYSSDRKKMLLVKLKKVPATPQQIKKLDDSLETLNYEMNDC